MMKQFLSLSLAAALIVQCSLSQPLPRDSLTHQHRSSSMQNERSLADVEIIKVTRLVLVNTVTGNDIMDIDNATVFDIQKVGANVTIRAETTDLNGCGWVLFDLDDGSLQHTDLNKPFSLAGNDTGGKLLPTSRLSQIGTHTLRVSPSVDGSLLAVPDDLAEFPIEDNRANFKSCWYLKDFKGIKVDGTPVIPENKTDVIVGDINPGSVTGNSSVPVKTESSLPSRLSDFVTTNAASLTSFLMGETGRRQLKGVDRRRDQTTLTTQDDGSVFVTFSVRNGPSTLAPTPAPKPNNDVSGYSSTAAGTIQGDFKVWNKLTIGFIGPSTSELGSSVRGPYGPLGTFKDFRTEVSFKHIATGSIFVVPGYFALDGDAANSVDKAQDGSVWLTHFVPNLAGDWTWKSSFRQGENCAPNGGGESAGYFDGQEGFFAVEAANPDDPTMNAKDLRKKGKLQYVGKSQLQFAGSKDYFLKAGPDSPENFLAYSGFDGATNKGGFLKKYTAHVLDYVPTDPTWSAGNGTGIIGALNYLSSSGSNIITVTAITVNGPDGNVHPFIDPNLSTVSFDVSKLAQWEVVFDWAERKGIVIRFKFSDSESDDIFDSGFTYEERRTFYREMIARFGHHLGLIWDLGQDMTNINEIVARTEAIRAMDPYGSPIMVQTAPSEQDLVYGQLYGNDSIDIISAAGKTVADVASKTASFLKASTAKGRSFAVSSDAVESSALLWANILSGGMGSQMSFGASENLSLQDFRAQAKLLKEAGIALNFFSSNEIPFQDMKSTIDTGYVSLSSTTSKIVVTYKEPGAVTLKVDFPDTSNYSVSWTDPSTGVTTSGTAVTGGTDIDIGAPPVPNAAWVCLMKAA